MSVWDKSSIIFAESNGFFFLKLSSLKDCGVGSGLLRELLNDELELLELSKSLLASLSNTSEPKESIDLFDYKSAVVALACFSRVSGLSGIDDIPFHVGLCGEL